MAHSPDEQQATTCVDNIGPRNRRMRMRFGAVTLALTLAGAAVLLVLGVARPWRLALFLPLAAGATGIFQARAHT